MEKILHIIDNLWLGWAQTVVKWIFDYNKDNSDYFLYGLRKTEIMTEINHKNIFVDSSINKFSFPIFKLRKFIKENNIEILHCHLAKSQIIWWILKILFFPNIKLIFHEHGRIFQKGKIYPFFMNIFREYVNIYIAVSMATKNQILEKTNFREEKIIKLYNFVDLNKFKKIEKFDIGKERKKYWFQEQDFIIWFAGRLIETKWWREFVNSAKILIDAWYNIKFIIAWDWEDEEKIRTFIHKNNLQENMKMVWYISDMVSFYHILDCFVFLSHRESLWLTWIEANACGCPVIASDIEWLNEIMIHNKNALLFKKQNIDDLVEKIERIYKNEQLRNDLIKIWFEEVKKYSLDKYLVELNKVYE